jgi:glycyl-tRNA synthetase
MNTLVKHLSALLRQHRVHHVIDTSGVSIGRRYSRQDQVGTPFGITVDFESIQHKTYTLRERDSMAQVRATEAEIVAAIVSLVNGDEDWESVARRLPKFEGQEVDKADLAGGN